MLALFVAGSAFGAEREDIVVSAAMSLKASFEEIGKVFMERNGDINIVFNFSSSGKLRQQIEGGAPVDVFASASEKEMDRLSGKGLIVEETRHVFAGNSIVMIVPSDGMKGPATLTSLNDKDVTKIVMGDPEMTPVGMYSREVLAYAGVWDGLREKLVYAAHVRQILDYVSRGEVDAGLVYATDAKIREREVRVVFTAGRESHRKIAYPIAMVKGTGKAASAQKFIDFVLSDEAGGILRSYGFTVEDEGR